MIGLLLSAVQLATAITVTRLQQPPAGLESRAGLVVRPYIRNVDPEVQQLAKSLPTSNRFESFLLKLRQFNYEDVGDETGLPPVTRDGGEAILTRRSTRVTNYGIDLNGAIIDVRLDLFGVSQSLVQMEEYAGFWRKVQNRYVFYGRGLRCSARIVGLNVLGMTGYWISDQKSDRVFGRSVTLQEFGAVDHLKVVSIGVCHHLGDVLGRLEAAMSQEFSGLTAPGDDAEYEPVETTDPMTVVTWKFPKGSFDIALPRLGRQNPPPSPFGR